ncbi:hypothetical protein PC116_g3839 [Phytophthora cactorum]|uniref:Uncharacterized protein n=1 Tax=Phytophthora cactorum TaxID=29920 RepID=A0A8T1LFS7_9STRA|nr:hypothetical protein PC114_g3604 [Phytophthora cactorum]KAG2951013.1 hypothetical protein PC117_g3926 [Phytophthora cactorum]KAG3190108.1 hypothetical protein C6341_g1896 [Phytophthora cactorum]KAG3205169.1 hypothetical protein PC128_g1577 [Phytophthora cactorum]KAG4057822.1 hypothetical protein PC123_g7197 [Phytophthora cactorum]
MKRAVGRLQLPPATARYTLLLDFRPTWTLRALVLAQHCWA